MLETYQIELVIFGGRSYEYFDLVAGNERIIISSIDERMLHGFNK
jgi:hypothetical protein